MRSWDFASPSPDGLVALIFRGRITLLVANNGRRVAAVRGFAKRSPQRVAACGSKSSNRTSRIVSFLMVFGMIPIYFKSWVYGEFQRTALSAMYLHHGIAPNKAPTPAVRAMASAPQKVTRATDLPMDEPPAYAANAPSKARNTSEAPETVHDSVERGTMKISRKGNAAPTAKAAADASAA